MTRPTRPVVLDASAVLAYLGDEPGADAVEPALRSAALSAVNLAEIVTKLDDRGADPHRLLAGLTAAGLEVVDFSLEDAVVAGELRTRTRHLGLSLGDRCCLALALRTPGTRVLTTDRAWGGLDLPLEITLLR